MRNFSRQPNFSKYICCKPQGHYVPIWLQYGTLTSCQSRLDELGDHGKVAAQLDGRVGPEFGGA